MLYQTNLGFRRDTSNAGSALLLPIKKTDKSRMVIEDQIEVDNSSNGNSEDLVFDEKKVYIQCLPSIVQSTILGVVCHMIDILA